MNTKQYVLFSVDKESENQNIKHHKEYRKDGTLMYECTYKFLDKTKEFLYPERVTNRNGKSFIRINHATKYEKDGSVQWKLQYNKQGRIIKSYRKYGS